MTDLVNVSINVIGTEKKTIDVSTQTEISTRSIGTQTDPPLDVPPPRSLLHLSKYISASSADLIKYYMDNETHLDNYISDQLVTLVSNNLEIKDTKAVTYVITTEMILESLILISYPGNPNFIDSDTGWFLSALLLILHDGPYKRGDILIYKTNCYYYDGRLPYDICDMVHSDLSVIFEFPINHWSITRDAISIVPFYLGNINTEQLFEVLSINITMSDISMFSTRSTSFKVIYTHFIYKHNRYYLLLNCPISKAYKILKQVCGDQSKIHFRDNIVDPKIEYNNRLLVVTFNS